MRIYYIGEFAEKIGVSTRTLRRWDNKNFFGAKRTDGGRRFYTDADYYKYLEYLNKSSSSQKTALSSSEYKKKVLSLKETLISLVNQISEIEEFL